ncbi:MAG TPA: excinuclease ABC subunit UvrC, partial [Sediminispirochaeta sp.]|nr:excinuclease ABC subunit UvrC [Sediminispirochaeta sp.]
MYEAVKASVEEFPHQPGVYLMKNSQDKIIYIGKAKDLRKRVGSYFSGKKELKTRVLVSKIHSVEYILTGNEYDALLLENNLIKEHNPRYNINLKDGKSYPAIRVTNEKYPRIFRTRRIIQDGSRYFGPYTEVGKIDTYLELIEKTFPLRKCRGPLKRRDHPCLYYHIGRCSAPCVGKISQADYMKHVEEAVKLLSGETEELLRGLHQQMEAAAAELDYERAAELRDRIQAVGTVGTEQEIVDFNMEKRDYVATVQRDTLCSFVVFQMRSGKMVGRDLFRAESFGTEEESFAEFFFQYYGNSNTFPDFIYIDSKVEARHLERFFHDELGRQVEVHVPREDRHSRILRMARENASQDVERRLKAIANIPGLEELKQVLALPKLPRRIEGFDIAQLSGK